MVDKRELSGRERVFRALSFQEIDRVPVIPVTHSCAPKKAGYLHGEAMQNPKKYVASQLKCLEMFDYDAVWGMAVNEVAEALGCEIVVHSDDVPAERNGPLINARDLNLLAEPDLNHSIWMNRKEEVVRQLKKEVGKQVVVIAPAITPIRAAVMARGIQNFFLDFIDAPEFTKNLLEICTRHCITAAKRLAESGADFLFFPLPEASRDMISRSHYEEFVHPCMKKIKEAMEYEGIKTFIHTCGNWSDRFGLVADLKPDVIQLAAEVDLRSIRIELGNRVGLFGKIKSVGTLFQGTPAAVRSESRENILDADGMRGGFILASDCAVPRDTPVVNIQAMVDAAREFVEK
jgi:MtaA/CmuA family methyltransferase